MRAELHKNGDCYLLAIPNEFLHECGIQETAEIYVKNNRIIIEAVKSKKDRPEKFVNFVMDFCKNENKAALAALKAGDNPQRKWKSESCLQSFYVFNHFDSENEYTVYAAIAAAIAKADVSENGNAGIGKVIARCYDITTDSSGKKEVDKQAVNKLRRLLACDSTEEVCRVFRSLFSLIEARGLSKTIDYISLLGDLENFHVDWRREKIKQDWARDFYGRLKDKDNHQDGEND